MRLVGIAVLLVAVLAHADDKSLRAYDGQIIISPDPIPSSLDQLRVFLKANATPDRRYELIKGPPWDVNLVGVLSKDPGAAPVTLVITDTADKKATPLHSGEHTTKHRLLMVTVKATTAAGFDANRTYRVQILLKEQTLASAELKLRN